MEILLHEEFKRNFKTLYKKFPSLLDDIDALIEALKVNPTEGESLGKDCLKSV